MLNAKSEILNMRRENSLCGSFGKLRTGYVPVLLCNCFCKNKANFRQYQRHKTEDMNRAEKFMDANFLSSFSLIPAVPCLINARLRL